MKVEQEEYGSEGSFFVKSDKRKQAEMTYTWAGEDRIIIDHTEVSNELRGKGVGKLLVKQAVAFARERSISIIPLCSFARSVFNRHPDFNDVL